MLAKPQLNGNSVNDFAEAHAEIRAAVDAIDAAAAKVRQNITHGRNYQHLGDALNGSAREDAQRFEERFAAAKESLLAIQSEIVEVLEERV